MLRAAGQQADRSVREAVGTDLLEDGIDAPASVLARQTDPPAIPVEALTDEVAGA